MERHITELIKKSFQDVTGAEFKMFMDFLKSLSIFGNKAPTERVQELSQIIEGQADLDAQFDNIFLAVSLFSLGYERPRIKIPASVMIPIARMLEKTYNIFGPYGMKVPQLTPSRIRLLTCNRTFSSRKANDRLAYVLIVPLQEGLKQTIESYSGLRAERLPRKEGPSKAALFLGNEIVADILLWREKTMTCTAMVGLVVFYLSFVKLHLERNSMSLLLSNIDEMDTDEITQPVEKVEVDIALSAHVNARRWYEEKKKQKSKQEKTHTAHTKAFKAAEKKTRSSNNSLNQSPHQQTTLAAILSAFRTRVEHGGPLVVSYKSPQLYFFYMYIMLL